MKATFWKNARVAGIYLAWKTASALLVICVGLTIAGAIKHFRPDPGRAYSALAVPDPIYVIGGFIVMFCWVAGLLIMLLGVADTLNMLFNQKSSGRT